MSQITGRRPVPRRWLPPRAGWLVRRLFHLHPTLPGRGGRPGYPL